jgi:hypothetical protein
LGSIRRRLYCGSAELREYGLRLTVIRANAENQSNSAVTHVYLSMLPACGATQAGK